MTVFVKDVPRESDERVLAALSLRRKGLTWHQIAARFGSGTYQSMQSTCARVMHADIAEEGDEVRAAYR